MIDKELAKLDPASVFKTPQDVMNENALTSAEKIDILQRWAYDEREMAVAEEENMINYTNKQTNNLDEIMRCLLELGVDSNQVPAPTKQG